LHTGFDPPTELCHSGWNSDMCMISALNPAKPRSMLWPLKASAKPSSSVFDAAFQNQSLLEQAPWFPLFRHCPVQALLLVEDLLVVLAEYPSEEQEDKLMDSASFLVLVSELEFFLVELVDSFHLPLVEAEFLWQVLVPWPQLSALAVELFLGFFLLLVVYLAAVSVAWRMRWQTTQLTAMVYVPWLWLTP
jgi:hypothetical protein